MTKAPLYQFTLCVSPPKPLEYESGNLIINVFALLPHELLDELCKLVEDFGFTWLTASGVEVEDVPTYGDFDRRLLLGELDG